MERYNFIHSAITNKIIRSFYKVYNTLGYGFLEKVYENSLSIELNKMELSHLNQQPVDVYYDSTKVGVYFADIIVENKVIIELKAAENICDDHEAQLLNYLGLQILK